MSRLVRFNTRSCVGRGAGVSRLRVKPIDGNYFCMKAAQRFSAASPAGDDHQA
jgi:hypothetical protein